MSCKSILENDLSQNYSRNRYLGRKTLIRKIRTFQRQRQGRFDPALIVRRNRSVHAGRRCRSNIRDGTVRYR